MYLCGFSAVVVEGKGVRKSSRSPSQSQLRPDPKLAQVGIGILSAESSRARFRDLAQAAIKFQKEVTGGTPVIMPEGVFYAAVPVCLIGYMMPPEPDHLIILSDIAKICQYKEWTKVWLIASRREKDFGKLSQQLSGLGLEVINAKTQK